MAAKTEERDDKRWNLLAQRYRERGLVLILGAGVSKASGLPDWPELLRIVGDRCWGEGGRNTVDALIKDGVSLPAVAGILESNRPKDTIFTSLLHDALYRDFPAILTRRSAPARKALVDFIHGRDAAQKPNHTLRAVAAMCARQEMAATKYVSNPQVRAVVTSNVDAVLRTYISARYGTWLLRTIDSAQEGSRKGRIPTYYMHGFLKFDGASGDPDEPPARCVFTEEEYYDFFNRPHSIFNYTMLYLLREYNCLFIGMSMQDQNIRRLLHYSTSERRAGLTGTPEFTGLRHFAMLSRPPTKELARLKDISLRRIGTRALWLDSHAEIPDRLGALYGATDWPSVYG